VAITFEIGDSSAPRGHAIAYFRAGGEVLATYVLVLPIPMDVGKYLPPLLASQLGGMLGGMLGEGMGSFAAPPVPEKVESVDYLRRLANARGDDLIAGGTVRGATDIAASMNEAAEVVQEYNRLYEQSVGSRMKAVQEDLRAVAGRPAVEGDGGERVEHVLYGLMSDRDRLGELSKLVGTMRYATERADRGLMEETDGSIGALERLLPEHYWTAKVRAAAKDASPRGARLAQLYIERCYRLIDENYAAVEEIEKQIATPDRHAGMNGSAMAKSPQRPSGSPHPDRPPWGEGT
jgi:hypothetical protein